MLINILLVALGGSMGAVSRYLVSLWAAERIGTDFPYGTLLVNIVGCFIIGFFMTMTTEKYIVNPYWRMLVTVGFVGGLTTFSSFSYETFRLMADAGWQGAMLNMLGNCMLGFFATWLGIYLARLA